MISNHCLKNARTDLQSLLCGYKRTERCSASKVGSYLRLLDSFVTQFKAQGPSRTCNESKEEEEKKMPSALKRGLGCEIVPSGFQGLAAESRSQIWP